MYDNQLLVYFGSYTDGENKGRGIYCSCFDADSGGITPPVLAAECENPSYLLLKNGRLYAVNETAVSGGRRNGSIAAYEIRRNTGLELINRISSEGAYPVHLCGCEELDYILFVNYGSSDKDSSGIGVVRLEKNGALGGISSLVPYRGRSINEERQREPHAHSVNLAKLAGGKYFVLSSDLGTDKVSGYYLDVETGKLDMISELSVRPGYGPRHLAFGTGGKIVYQLNELVSEIQVCSLNHETCGLSVMQALPSHGASGHGIKNYPAEIAVHCSGRFLYVSNRGLDTIARFDIDIATGGLSFAEEIPAGGRWPRSFEISPDGRFLIVANQHSGNVVVFRIDRLTGRLDYESEVNVPAPVCAAFTRC